MKMRYKDYIALADKYEVASFIDSDPIQFCYRFRDKKDIEIAGVMSSWLSYGKRSVFLPKINYLLNDVMGGHPFDYIMSESWHGNEDNYSSLYRMTTWHNFYELCDKLKYIYLNNKDLEEAVVKNYENRTSRFKYYHQSLCDLLSGETMIPTSESPSSNKRMNMFLRWMVRRNSEVDLGIWKTIDTEYLLIPCDTHVITSALKLKIITKGDASLNNTIRITDYAKRMFYEDPARMDFALYGYGIDKLNK